MKRVRVTPPTQRAVTLDEVRRSLIVTDTEHDDEVLAALQAAQETIERRLGRKLMSQTWDIYYDGFADPLVLPYSPTITEVAQVVTVTPANVEPNDTFSLTISGQTVSFVATEGTVANVTAGLSAAWNAAVHSAFTAITAADTGTTLTLTADVPGVAFVATPSTANGGNGNIDDQTLTATTTTDNVGPNPTYVKYKDTAGTWQTLATTVYELAQDMGLPCVRLKYEQSWPDTLSHPDSVVVRYQCGYGTRPHEVPATIREAIRWAAGWVYEHRGDDPANDEQMLRHLGYKLLPWVIQRHDPESVEA